MTNQKLKILFFTPYGGYTGSEMSLCHYLMQLDKDRFDVRLFSIENGELLNHLKQHIKVYHDSSRNKLRKRLIEKIKTKTGLQSALSKQILDLHKEFKPDFWFLNTIMLNEISELAINNNIPYCIYFHELDSQYGFVTADQLSNMCRNAITLIGCSDKVCSNLKILGAKRIARQYECIDTERIEREKNLSKPELIQQLRGRSKTIIGMSGQRIGRKGFDIFIKTAEKSKDTALHFIWLGTGKNNGYDLFLENYISAHQLNNVSLIVPTQKEYYSYLNQIDLFFLSSVEDPFPLVMLEAAYLNKYIIAFNSGGVSELLQEHPGKILSSHDPEICAAEILKTIQNKEHLIVKHQEPFPYSANLQVKKFEQLLLDLRLAN